MSHGLEGIVPFDTPGNFNFDPNKIVVDGILAQARLTQNPALIFAALYQRPPADSTAIDADFSRDGGSLVPLSGTANTDGLGNLDCRPNLFALYDAVGNAQAFTNQGAVRMEWIADPLPPPSTEQTLWQIGRSANNNNRLEITIIQFLSQYFFTMRIFSNTGAQIVVKQGLPPIAIVPGTQHELEVNVDLVNGLNDLYIDGLNFTTPNTTTGNRSTMVDQILIANRADFATPAGARYAGFSIFDQVQHTGPSYTVEGLGVFPLDNPIIKPNATLQATQFKEFAAVLAATSPDEIRFIMEVDGAAMWFDGANWVASDSSFAQSNTVAEVNDNALTLALNPAGSNIRSCVVLHSDDGLTTPNITSYTTTTDFIIPDVDVPNECLIFGTVLDANGNPEPGAVVFADHAGFFHGDNFIQGERIQDIADDEGKFSIQVVETASISLSPYTVRIGSRRSTGVQVPNQTQVAIGDLLPQLPQAS